MMIWLLNNDAFVGEPDDIKDIQALSLSQDMGKVFHATLIYK